MKISFEKSGFENIKADAYIFLCYEDKKLFEDELKLIQKYMKAKIPAVSLEDFKGKRGQTELIYTPSSRIILSGLGKRSEITLEKVRVAVYRTVKKARALKIKKIAIEIIHDETFADSFEDIARAETISCILGNYYFGKYYTSKDKKEGTSIKEAVFFTEKKTLEKYVKDIDKGIKSGTIIGKSTNLARDLGNEPSNILFPEVYANLIAERALNNKKYSVEILTLKEIKENGMGCVIAVSKGSQYEPRFLILRYNGGNEGEQPYIVIGKGVTFDSGGISIKQAAGMARMKLDMCGSAAVVGIVESASQLGLKLNIIGLIPIVENMPDGNALKPGDVISAHNGMTIEIDNTDAEGRLILADALSYAKQFDPKAVIDLATLTGAVVIAIGDVASAIMGNDQALIDKLSKAGLESNDKVWQLPLWEEYDKKIDSEIADVKNSGNDKQAGTITAGMFLKRFVKNYPWAHIDIAATAMRDSNQDYLPKNATGAGVRLVTQYLMDEANAKQNK